MATLRTLQIQGTDTSGKEVTKNLSNINPESTAAQLDAFSKKVNALTTNTYKDTMLIDKTSLNELTAE